jgi:phosphoglycolate phosphatase
VKPKHILLDLDGTLTDSRPGIFTSYRAALRSLGIEPDPDFDLTVAVGPAMPDAMGLVLAHYGDTRLEEAITAYRAHYAEVGLYENSVYDGIGDLLTSLTGAGRSLYLATSKRRHFAVQILEHFGLSGHFRAIYGSVPGGTLDHKPEMLAHILAEQGIAAADAVMIGDRRFDIEGARANGVREIGVLWGYGSRAELEQAGARTLVATPVELERLLLAAG